MEKLNKWTCPECGSNIIDYETICDRLECTGERGFMSWFMCWDNPLMYLAGVSGALVLMLVILAYIY